MTNTFETLFQQLIQAEIEKALAPLQEENQALRQELKETKEQVWELRQEFESLFQAKAADLVEEESQEETPNQEAIETEEETAPTVEEDITPYPPYLLDKPDSPNSWERNQSSERKVFKQYYPHFETVDLIKKIAEKNKRNPQLKARLRATLDQWGDGSRLLSMYAKFRELDVITLGKSIGYKVSSNGRYIYEPKDKAKESDSALPLTLEELKALAA